MISNFVTVYKNIIKDLFPHFHAKHSESLTSAVAFNWKRPFANHPIYVFPILTLFPQGAID